LSSLERHGVARVPSPELTASVYQHFAPFVRRTLSQLGVRDADLPDLCHEVFLVVHAKSASLGDIDYYDLWLREICRRVSAGYRRRSSRRLESLSAEPPVLEADGPPIDLLVTRDEEDLVRDALAALDEESRELLALHDVGELSLSELSRLTLHDRKTVRKRLQLARRRLATLMRHAEGPTGHRPASEASTSHAMPLRADAVKPLGGLQVLTATRDLVIGWHGNVAITVWTGVASADALEELIDWGSHMINACGGRLGYLALVEATVRPPPLAARRKIVEALDLFGPYVVKYATALLGGGAWIAQPIMSGLMVLARPRFPMRFFKSVEAGAAWLAEDCGRGPSGALTAAELTAASEYLRGVARAHATHATAG
jgi:RNA polymerase sigma-70 factor (ECF subfamily)